MLVVLVEQAAAPQVLRHPVARSLQHDDDLAGRQMGELAKHRLVTVPLGLLVGSIEEDRMDVGVELEVRRRALERHHGAAAPSATEVPLQPLLVETQHHPDEDARERRQERTVVAETLSPRERHREHPLPQRDRRQHVLDEVRRGRAHLPPETRRAEPAALAAERHQPRLFASVTPKTCISRDREARTRGPPRAPFSRSAAARS
jgi:hypothetical protein